MAAGSATSPHSGKQHTSTVASSYVRRADRGARRLVAPISTDVLGSQVLYYARVSDETHVSTSVRALSQRLAKVTINRMGLAEAIAFGLILRDETVFNEIRCIPPGFTLHPNGKVSEHSRLRSTSEITRGEDFSACFLEIFARILADLEPRWPVHCAGITAGKDSRILAAMAKNLPERWHWLSVSGRDDIEYRGAHRVVDHLGLDNHTWLQWTSAFLDGPAHRLAADLADGVGAVSDYSMMRHYFGRHRRLVVGQQADPSQACLWLGVPADGLIAGTYLAPAATTLWDALAPRTEALTRVLDARSLALFRDCRHEYDRNPFQFDAADETEIGHFIRLLTHGHAYICKTLGSLDWACPTQVNPYLHPDLVDLALRTDVRVLATDAARSAVLASLDPALDTPSLFGYIAPAYSGQVFRALASEARACQPLGDLLDPVLLSEIRSGRFPHLRRPGHRHVGHSDDPIPPYRNHAEESPSVIGSLRDYEHLLVYATFLNLVAADGTSIDID